MTLRPPTVLTRTVRYAHDGGRLLEHLAAAGLIATTTDDGPGARLDDPVRSAGAPVREGHRHPARSRGARPSPGLAGTPRSFREERIAKNASPRRRPRAGKTSAPGPTI